MECSGRNVAMETLGLYNFQLFSVKIGLSNLLSQFLLPW